MNTILSHTTIPKKKLRVLCLHGMYQNGKTFANKIQHLFSLSSDQMEFLFFDGPFALLPKVLVKNQKIRQSKGRMLRIQEKKEEEFRAWWRPPSPPPHLSTTTTEHETLTQLTEDREVLLEYLNQKISSFDGEIDGVFGFSQGASLASWLCSTEV
jgi:predicted esterase